MYIAHTKATPYISQQSRHAREVRQFWKFFQMGALGQLFKNNIERIGPGKSVVVIPVTVMWY